VKILSTSQMRFKQRLMYVALPNFCPSKAVHAMYKCEGNGLWEVTVISYKNTLLSSKRKDNSLWFHEHKWPSRPLGQFILESYTQFPRSGQSVDRGSCYFVTISHA
jgi:hypothetical protein